MWWGWGKLNSLTPPQQRQPGSAAAGPLPTDHRGEVAGLREGELRAHLLRGSEHQSLEPGVYLPRGGFVLQGVEPIGCTYE